ncbi:MAG: GNAT family N-acetyltransferase [Pseudomonadota bacterium]
MIYVTPGYPLDPGAATLLRASHALMEELFEPESNNYLDFEALKAPHIQFYIATDGKVTFGTGAIAVYDDYAEIKSMFVAETARGKGVASMILKRLEMEARVLGKPWLKLESGDKLAAALKMYERHGFTYCEKFGDYVPTHESIFMEKRLG